MSEQHRWTVIRMWQSVWAETSTEAIQQTRKGQHDATFAVRVPDSTEPRERLVSEICAVLDRHRDPGHNWTEDEKKAYDDGGRWREGLAAVTRLRAEEIIELMRTWRERG